MRSAFQCTAEFTKAAKDERIISGVASTANPDRQGQIVDQTSLAAAASRYMKLNPVIFYMHKWDAPIGKAISIASQGDSLLVTSQIGKGFDVPVGFTTIPVDDIWSQIEQGILRGYSIGFNATIVQKEAEPDFLTDIELFEVSVVTVPANAEAVFGVVKQYQLPGESLPSLFQQRTRKSSIVEVALEEGAPDVTKLVPVPAVEVHRGGEDEEAEVDQLIAVIRGANESLEEVKAASILRELKACRTQLWTK